MTEQHDYFKWVALKEDDPDWYERELLAGRARFGWSPPGADLRAIKDKMDRFSWSAPSGSPRRDEISASLRSISRVSPRPTSGLDDLRQSRRDREGRHHRGLRLWIRRDPRQRTLWPTQVQFPRLGRDTSIL